MRRLAIVATLVGLFGAALAAPALADKPTVITDSVSFVDIDACTGLEQEISADATISVHEHRNVTVVNFKRTGETSSGYVTQSTENFVATERVLKDTFNDILRADDGRMMRVSGAFVINLNRGTFQVEKFTFTCIRGETILP